MAMGALPISPGSESKSEAERPKQHPQNKPEPTTCAPTLGHKSRTDSAEDPNYNGEFHLSSRAFMVPLLQSETEGGHDPRNRQRSTIMGVKMFGGNAWPTWPAPQRFWRFGIDMTAIAVIVPGEGFAIAADGFCTADDGIVAREHEQKIFQARCMGNDVAYTVAGKLFNEHETYNFVSGVKVAMRAAARRRFRSFGEYIDTIGSAAGLTISDALQRGAIDPDPLKAEFAGMFIVGYFNGQQPSLGIIVLSSDGSHAVQIHAPPEHHRFMGSDKITDLINSGGDERMMKYFHPHECSRSLEEATNLAKTYVEACCDPIAKEIDPCCRFIGGRIHVATVTRANGFQWIIPPVGSAGPRQIVPGVPTRDS